MNREFKRRMLREQRAQERLAQRAGPRPPVPVQHEKRERTRIREYLREIRAELRRVMWPTASEVFTYSVVVIFVVTVLTGVVFALDLGFAKAFLNLFGTKR